MKGTLFSADFIKDNSGDLRLLELNTDTSILEEQIPQINWQGLLDVLNNNSLTQLDVIYKPVLHVDIIEALEGFIASKDTSITFLKHPEDRNAIYPTQVESTGNNFILRLAYDEAAILDSNYAKGRLDLYKLFYNNNSNDNVTRFYHESNGEVINTLDYSINQNNIPDATIKSSEESHNPIGFYKIGTTSEGQSNEEKWTSFIDENKTEDNIIEQYHFDNNNLDEENKITSVRTFKIVYGGDLNLIDLVSYKQSSIFSIPETVEWNEGLTSNKLGAHHYYEFTTNIFKVDGAGLLSTKEILIDDGSYKSFADISVGDTIKSYHIEGSPQVESDAAIMEWSHEGNQFPEGSFLTTSDVVFKNVENLNYGCLLEYVVDGESLFSGLAKQFLVFDDSTNLTTFKHAAKINPATDKFYGLNGELVGLDEVNFYITSDSEVKIVELDVEESDTYILGGSTPFNAVVSHNAPCFVAGTKITLGNGEAADIQDVKVGDEVLTFNFSKNCNEIHTVGGTGVKKVNKTVIYNFEDGTSLEATLDHPLYCRKHGWVSGDPDYTNAAYNLTTHKVCTDCEIVKADGSSVKIQSIEDNDNGTVVYSLRSVDVNHNYFANEYLVHNRCFVEGTEITMADGSSKKIEEVVAGDKVMSYDFDKYEDSEGIVGGITKDNVDNVTMLTFNNELVLKCTAVHPFYVKDKGWVKAAALEQGDECYAPGDGANPTWYVSTVGSSEGSVNVYSLTDVTTHNNYYANKVLVHNK